jgi:diguanylate cyclase (GGDEF)-like protein
MKSDNPNKQSIAQSKTQSLQTLHHQLGQQSQLLSRMITFYLGVTPGVDTELNSLREHLDGKSDFLSINQSMSKLSGLFSQNSHAIKLQNTAALNLFKHEIARLRDLEGIHQDLKNDAARLLKSLPKENTSLYALQPLFKQAMNLYQRALENVQLLDKASSSTPNVAPEKNAHHDITLELRVLLEQIPTNDVNQLSFKEITVMLTRDITRQQLLESCLVVIKALINDLLKERKHTRKMVTELHSSLTDVNAQMDSTIEIAETQHTEKNKNDTALLESITDCETTVEQETDIAALKEQTSKYLLSMSKTIKQGKQSNKAQQLEMMTLLRDMQAQLHKLERHTAVYKHRLVEQEQRNYRDELTNIPNRLAYNAQINVEYARWQRHGKDLCMVILDLDHFKQVNDNFGHAAGDKTLQVVAKCIANCLRSTDFLFRWGGEEFVLLLTQSDINEINRLLERIRQQIEQIPFKHKGKTITVTVSIGATSFKTGDTVESAFERADENLFKAKNSGRNKSVVS